MGRKDMKRFVFVTCALLVPMTTTAADSSAECLTNKYNQYAKAQEAWQRDFTKLIVEIAPRYEEVANIYMTDQLRAIERAKLAVAFFAREEPGKLRTQMSLNNWLNLDEADHRRIASGDERYGKLLELDAAARKRPRHPDGDGLRKVLWSDVMNSEKYQERLKALLQSVQAAEEIQCP